MKEELKYRWKVLPFFEIHDLVSIISGTASAV
jgi:hypothetical protein